jgi:hypothetical protein
MTPPPDLDSLSHEDMKSLILTLLARVAELEAQLGKPAKNSSNSSVPPSKEFKANASKGKGDKPKRKGPRRGQPRAQGPESTAGRKPPPDRPGDGQTV